MPRRRGATPVRIAAAVGALFGLLTVVAGTRVLAGVDVQTYVVLRWLVWYNVAAGAFGVAVASGLWANWRRATWAALAMAGTHGGVLVALLAWRAAGGTVADDSLAAMTLRTLVWSAIAGVARRVVVGPPEASVGPDEDVT